VSPTRSSLEQEARVFTRFIARVPATPYVTDKYVEAHLVTRSFRVVDRFDRWLIAIAAVSPALTRLADAYTRLFFPRGVLRRKLILLLAIVESSAPFHRGIDRVPPGLPAIVVLQLLASVIGGILAAVAGTTIFGPLQIVARVRGWRA